LAKEKKEEDSSGSSKNMARFSVENPGITVVFLLFALILGAVGYKSMPQRKDPYVPVRQAAVQVPWPGNKPEQIEQLVTRKIEAVCGKNKYVKTLESTVQPGVSITFIELEETVKDASIQFDDIGIKLANAGPELPPGAGPIIFIKDFGDTAALMLTVASPPCSALEIEARAAPISRKIEKARSIRKKPGAAFSVVYCYPQSVNRQFMKEVAGRGVVYAKEKGIARDIKIIEGEGFIALDFISSLDENKLSAIVKDYSKNHLKIAEMNPDTWPPVLIKDPSTLNKILVDSAPDRYTYSELDDYTEIIADGLRTIPSATSVARKGVLGEALYLIYDQDRLAAYGVNPARLPQLIAAQNITGATGPFGMAQEQGEEIFFQTGGQFQSTKEVANLIIGESEGAPVYLRDLAAIEKSYKLPATYLNYLTWKNKEGAWSRGKAITLSVQMKPGEQIEKFGKDVDAKLKELALQVPDDLVIDRTSDQPRQVKENIDLFNTALIEAVILVVLVSLIGFWDWRSALLMALSIPITLMMTYGGMWALGVDLQQVSIASLIIALGLLVDNPVVAGDSIKVALSKGLPRRTAAWKGPTKLFKAIAFATLTNVAAYIPLATIPGDVGKFLVTLPIVIAVSLVASVITAQCFVPTIGMYLLKSRVEPSVKELRTKGFTGYYYRFANYCVHHRWYVVGVALILLVTGILFASRLPTQMFPYDLQYICTVDINLASNSALTLTNKKAQEAEKAVIDIAQELGKEIGAREGERKEPVKVLKTICTFLGGGGPRFWFSIQPEMAKLSYAQLIIECNDKHYTDRLVERLIRELPERVSGVLIDVRKLQTGTSFKTPVEVYLSGPDTRWKTLLGISSKIENIYRNIPEAMAIRNDWGQPIETVNIEPIPEKARMVGITNSDIARSVALGLDGLPVGILLEGRRRIPIVARLLPQERAHLSDLANLYAYSASTGTKVPLREIVKGTLEMEPYYIKRRNFHHCIKPGCFPLPGEWASQVFNKAWPEIKEIELPPGYSLAIGGEKEKQNKNFPALGIAMMMSVMGIFLCLVIQFKSPLKPFIVFAAVPFGMLGALTALIITGMPFGFMAFLGIASLVGVIVSHIIVLFDYIEEMHAKGEPLMEAVIDAGLARLRPVLITVCATVFALFPLAIHGGPLWQPMCYAQIGGLSLATLVTLILVPTIYCIFVLDLKLVKWEEKKEPEQSQPEA